MSALRSTAGGDAARAAAPGGRSARTGLTPRWLGLLFALALLLVPSVARANPDLRLETIETEHFWVHYHAQDVEFAERVAMQAERAYRKVTVLLGHRVRLKTHIVISDETDSANGLANAVPFPRIRLNVTAPSGMSVLGAYDDWIDILVTHEFVHVVHLDTVHGLPRLINAVLGFGVLGKVSGPNIVQPRWYVEGLATYYESALLSQGRDRSAHFDMFLRMAVLEGRFQTLDRVTSSARIYPHGTSVYLYGLHLVHYIADHYGQDKLQELSHIYGGRLIPFGVNRAMEDVIGVDFDQLWKEFRTDTERRFRAQARQIRARGVRAGRRLTFSASASASGQHARAPFWSPDDQSIVYYDDTGQRRAGFRRIPRAGLPVREGDAIGKEGMQPGTEQLLDVMDSSVGDFVGASGRIVHDMIGTHDFRYRWSDLYLWAGPDPEQREQLTFGIRAREPSVSPDGRSVVFVRSDTAQSRLAFLDLATREVVELAPRDRLQQVYRPRFSPDGRRVAYSMWLPGGYRDIWVYDRGTGEHERITATRYMDLSPTWTPDGRYLLFSSDRTGVFNLYAHELESGRLYQVTNVLGGAFEPAVSRDGELVAYVGFTSAGFDVWLMELDPAQFMAVMPSSSAVPPALDPTPAIEEDEGRPPAARARRYQPIKTLFPRTIFPTALEFGSSTFLTDLGFITEIADVAGFHSAVGSFRYLADYRAPSGSVSYTWSRLFPTVNLGFGRSYFLRSGFSRYVYDDLGSEEGFGPYRRSGYLERSTRFSGSLSVPILSHPIHSARARIGYDFNRLENLDEDEALVDPNAPSTSLPEVGDVAAVQLGMSYSNVQGYRYSYGAERGRRVGLSIDVLDERLGGDFGDIQVTGSYTEYVPMPWRGHQVLALRLQGGASAGGLARRGAFGLGGFSEDQDVIRRLLTRTAFGEGGVLRGYPTGAYRGRYFGLLNAEYRIPIIDVDRGMSSVPAMLERVALNTFTDWGLAWTDTVRFQDLVGSVGASLIFALKLGYGDRIDLFFQYAHGFDPELGLDYFRVVVARQF